MESITAVAIPEETKSPPISDDTGPAQIDSWTDFTAKTSFHGVRYIFERPGPRFRRRIWLLVVITALSVFLVQVGIRTGNYLEYKTTLDVGVRYMDLLEFPAVTICNQNRHRTTAVVERGLYDVIDEVFKTSNLSKIPWENFGDRVNGIDYGEFTLQTGHQKHIFIDSCTWNGIDCDIDRDFEAVLTDLGLCYTFNGQENVSTVSTPKAGAGSGLKLVINVEQYEYMRGPQYDAGIKILLHTREETPIMQEYGFAAAPGSHTLVAMKRYEVITLQPPYGICHPENSLISHCYAQCEARDVINACGCQTEYMQPINTNETTTCDFKTRLSCVRQTLAEMTMSELECICKPPCKHVHYEPQLSYAQLSKFNIDRMILDNPEKQNILQESYLKVRETNQHYIQEIKEKDTAAIKRLMTLANSLQYSLQDIQEKMTDPLTTSQYYNLPPIIFQQPLDMDLEAMNSKLNKLVDIADNWLTYSRSLMLANIDNVENIFLEWDGSVFRFHQFLIGCLQEAAAAQQSDSLDGSGDEDLDLSNERKNIHMSAKCNARLQSKVISLYNLLPDIHIIDFPQVKADYLSLLDSMFQNSTTSPDAFEEHEACLHALGLEVQDAFLELYSNLENFTKVDMVEDAIAATSKIIIKVNELIGVRNNISQCSWVFFLPLNMIHYMEGKATNAILRNDILMKSFYTMPKKLVSMAEDVELHVKLIFEKLTAYRNENVTKLQLASYMISLRTTKAIESLSQFESDGNIVIKSLQEDLEYFKDELVSIFVTIVESPIVILKVEEIQNLAFFKLSYATNRTEFQHLIDGLSEDLTNMQKLLDLVFSEYNLRFQECLSALPEAFKEISDHLAMLRSDLLEYAESSSLNVNFIMENFLHLDIFYKDMSYEVMAQQEAFGLLSLLSEVGGFLGLLLGASVITVCELLDYLLLNLAARYARSREEDTNVANVESAGKKSE